MVKRGKFKVIQRVCADWAGGHGQGGAGKHCVRFKKIKTTKYHDVGTRGHGKLSSSVRSRIKKAIHKGAFGKSKTFSSLNRCEREVNKQKSRGVPKAIIIKRIALIKTFNKNKSPRIVHIANKCMDYTRGLY